MCGQRNKRLRQTAPVICDKPALVNVLLHHGATREAARGLISFLSLAGTLLVFNAIGVPPWLLVPSALTVAVVVGFLLGARTNERSP